MKPTASLKRSATTGKLVERPLRVKSPSCSVKKKKNDKAHRVTMDAAMSVVTLKDSVQIVFVELPGGQEVIVDLTASQVRIYPPFDEEVGPLDDQHPFSTAKIPNA